MGSLHYCISHKEDRKREEKNNYVEILSAFSLFPGGKMLLRSEREREMNFTFLRKKNGEGNNFCVFK